MKVKLFLLFMVANTLCCYAQPAASYVSLVNATTNTVTLSVFDYFNAGYTVSLLPGAVLHESWVGATFSNADYLVPPQADGAGQTAVFSTLAGEPFVSVVVTGSPPLLPPLPWAIHYWFWGVTAAIILGLSGASRRLLGKVHEVNTEL